ncbi:Heat shock 70 kDa protein 12A [Blastocladiella emersonii ATCC 22665]|nr:Heat shock 70 kDa protein 12A [Blastocladiella emersonii ATCC 22665]
MTTATDQEKHLAIAVDFGTSHSGLALPTVQLEEVLMRRQVGEIGYNINVITSWPDDSSRYPKTLSAVLYDLHASPVARGNTALKVMLADENNNTVYKLIRRVKLLLAEDRTYHDPNMQLLPIDACRVISDLLIYLLDDVESRLAQAGWENVDRSKIIWCMTIPTM